jgi:hypothetical protein
MQTLTPGFQKEGRLCSSSRKAAQNRLRILEQSLCAYQVYMLRAFLPFRSLALVQKSFIAPTCIQLVPLLPCLRSLFYCI